MDRRARREELIRLGDLILRLRAKLAEVEAKFDRVDSAVADDDDEGVSELLDEDNEPRRDVAQQINHERRTRKSKFPEGPPLNRKVLEVLRKSGTPCGYEDVLKDVTAHHQSILNALRDLEHRGYAMKLDTNRWIAADRSRAKGALKVLD